MDTISTSNTAQQIETYLFDRRTWVPVKEICDEFCIRQRALRGLDGRPGLCSEYAISSDAGLKHVAHATTQEWLRFKHRLRRHGINELVRVSKLDRRRSTITRKATKPTFYFQPDTGQGSLFPPNALFVPEIPSE